MKYLHRTLERKFMAMNSFFKVILVTGARQVGKTTMLQHLAKDQDRTYVTLDNLQARELAKDDPALFFQRYKPPIIIDEVQYAPELFSQIKLMADASEETGLFWLTGSQQFSVMKNVQESLAGRIGILTLYSLSQSEKAQVQHDGELDFELDSLLNRQEKMPENNISDVFEGIWRGGMPQVLGANNEQRQLYFDSYIDTYLMRDITEFGGITDALRFRRFMVACAALIGQQVNYSTLAEAAEISQPTAKEWLRLLEGMNIVYLLRPFSNNALKRLTKTPKLYFCDTGLCAYLSSWLTPETLMDGAANGHFFENYVVAELYRNYAYSKNQATLSYYRDSNGKEIDVLVELDNKIHPLEVKMGANPNRREAKKFAVLEKSSLGIGRGGIICMADDVIPIDEKNTFIPCNVI